MSSLFTFGRPAKGNSFTDREKETAKLISNFKYAINTFIVSPRRWGKTSLVMRAISELDAKDIKTVYVDVYNCRDKEAFCEKLAAAVLSQTASRADEILENAKEIISRITLEFGLSPTQLNPFDVKLGIRNKESDLESMLDLPQRIAIRQNANIIVCIDEFQQIGGYQNSLDFQKTLRSIWQHQDKVTYCLFGSRKHMMESLFDNSDKPFYKFGDIMYLDCIPVDYWVRYIQGKFQQEGKQVSEELCQRICDTVEFNSSYIQQLAWYLFLETENVATDEDLDAAIEELVAQNTPLFESRTESLTAYQLNYLRAVADGYSTGLSSSYVVSRYKLGSSANVAAIGKMMKERDLVQEMDGKITLSDPVMRFWLSR